MPKLFFSLALLLSVVFSSAQSNIAVGSTVPDFTFTDTDGNTSSLSALTSAGFHVAVNFVFDECIPCLETAPFVEESYLNFGCNADEVYFITIVNGTAQEALNFQADFDFSFPIATSADAVSDYGVAAFPTLVVISPNNIMLRNDIWPIVNAFSIEVAFLSLDLDTSPCGNLGCTDSLASNYDSTAVVDDGSCTFSIDVSGFSLTDIYGESISLSAILAGGQHILFHFMGDWNSFDQNLSPEINSLYNLYGCNAHDLFVIAINNSLNGNASSLQFVEDYNFLPPMVSIEGGSESVRLGLGVEAFPTLLLVNPNSEIVGSDLYIGVGNTFGNTSAALDQNGIATNSCTFPGCVDTQACNFNSTADTDDGSCDYSCAGCMDPSAINYDSSATINDGSCQFVECDNLGQVNWPEFNTGVFAGNSEMQIGMQASTELAFSMTEFFFDATTSTTFPVSNFNLQSVTGLPNGIDCFINGTLNGTAELAAGEQACIQLVGTPLESGDFVIGFTGTLTIQVFGNWNEVTSLFTHHLTVLPLEGDLYGCTYSIAANYNPVANIDDGSCEYAGCTSIFAVNYNPLASIDDGSCIEAEGICGPGSYWDLELQMCIVPEVCVGDLNNDEEVSALDLLLLLAAYGTFCD